MPEVVITTELASEFIDQNTKITDVKDLMLKLLKAIGADGMMSRTMGYDSYGRKIRYCECTLKNFCWRTDGMIDCIPYKLINGKKVPIKWKIDNVYFNHTFY